MGRSEGQGALKETGNPLDLAVEGEGYFQVTRPDGSLGLTRDGAFDVDANGQIVDSQGNRLHPPISLPKGVLAGELRIAQDGTVTAAGKRLGRIELVDVPAPDHLAAEGGGLLVAGAASGAPKAASGHIHQGALEDSNVDIGRDMATMMTAERAFQMQSTAIQTESQMMAIANELRT